MTKKIFKTFLILLLLIHLVGCIGLLEDTEPQQGTYGIQQQYGTQQYGTQRGAPGYQQQRTGYQQPQTGYQQQGQLGQMGGQQQFGQMGGQMQMGGQIQTAGQQQFAQTAGQQQFGQMGGQQQFGQMGGQQQFGQTGGQPAMGRMTNTGGAVNSKLITVMIANRFGKMVQVILGPERFMEKNGVNVKNGDFIQVSGVFVDQGQSVFVANSVTKDQKTVQLRNFNGMPIWPRESDEGRFCFWPF